uniref:Small ribosomal subunit protein bS16 n=1 Tax=Eiseniibacteriota bacterium TaxID=2212470 RepID=A0A832I2Q1_UNCEI
MPVVIRLMRAGAKKRPFYRMVAADSRRQRDGRFIEILGHYDPLKKPFELVVHKDKVEAWLKHGAQPSEQAASLLRSVGLSWVRPSKPAKKTAGAAQAKAPAAKRKPRKVSERKAKAKAARKAGKKKPRARKEPKK